MDQRISRNFLPGHSTASPLNVRYRLGKIQKLGLLKGKWLDLGCADGSYTVSMPQFGVEAAVGADVVKDRIELAQERWNGNPNVRFVHTPDSTLPFAEGSFDGVLMNEVLEHVYDEAETLRGIHNVLRPGGHLVIMSPNRYFPFEGHGGQIGNYVLHFPVPLLPWLPSRIGQRMMRARNYWPYELKNLVAKEGFEVTDVDFVWPVLEVYKWLPATLIRQYQKLIPLLEAVPGLRRFGVSVLIVARKLDKQS